MTRKKEPRVAIYARVSTSDQDPEMQIRELREYASHRGFDVVVVLVDKESGAKERRPELDRLWALVRSRKVDAVLVWRFDRFARSTKQLVDALEEFNHLGVDFISLKEQIDTSSPMGKAMFTIISAIAEFEREIITERIRGGIARARAEGKRLGRPPVSADVRADVKRLRKENLSIREIARKIGVSKSAVFKVLNSSTDTTTL